MKPLGVFLVLTFGLSSPWYLLIATGGGLAQQGYVLALMWCPAVAAVGTQIFFHGTPRGLGWRWPSSAWVALGYLISIAYSLVAGSRYCGPMRSAPRARDSGVEPLFKAVCGRTFSRTASGEVLCFNARGRRRVWLAR